MEVSSDPRPELGRYDLAGVAEEPPALIVEAGMLADALLHWLAEANDPVACPVSQNVAVESRPRRLGLTSFLRHAITAAKIIGRRGQSATYRRWSPPSASLGDRRGWRGWLVRRQA